LLEDCADAEKVVNINCHIKEKSLYSRLILMIVMKISNEKMAYSLNKLKFKHNSNTTSL